MSKKGKETKEKKQEETKKEEKKKETAQEEKKEIVYQAAPDPTMTFYTGFAILAALVSVAATAFATILTSDPVVNAGYSIFKQHFDSVDEMAGGLDGFTAESVSQFAMQEGKAKIYVVLVIVGVVLIYIATLVSLFCAIRSINPDKKPLILVGVLGFACSLGALLAFVIGHFQVLEEIKAAMKVMYPEAVAETNFYPIYHGNLIAAAANVLFSGINVFGILYGYNRFVRDGKAF